MRVIRAIAVAALLVSGTSCRHPPTAPTMSDGVSANTVASPVALPLFPPDGGHISIAAQPLAFVTRNASAAGVLVVDTLEVATDPNFSSRTVSTFVQDAGGQTSTTAPRTFTAGRYYWRVRASAGDVVGPSSPTFSFVIDSPAPPATLLPPTTVEPLPDSVQPSRAVLLVTNPVYPAGTPRMNYRFQLARDASFTSVLQQFDVHDSEYFGSGGSTRVDLGFAAGSDLPPGDVYWRVKSVDAVTGAASGYTPAWHFSVGSMFIDPPSLVAPIQGAQAPSAHPTLTLNMGKHSGRIYDVVLQIDVSSNPSFTAPLAYSVNLVDADIGISRITAFATLAPGRYYWRARATLSVQFAATVITSFTPTETFVVGPMVVQAPVLVQPISGVFAHARPTLVVKNAERSGISGRLSYQFQVLAGSTLVAAGTVPEDLSGQTSWTVPSDLPAGAAYSWRVSATDPASGVTSPDGSIGSFQVVPAAGNPYTLQVVLPCQANGPAGPPTFTFDAGTSGSISGSILMVTTAGSLTLQLTNANGAISGSMDGIATSGRITVRVSSAKDATDPATVSGSAGPGGVLRGTIAGYVYAADSFDYSVQCSDSTMSWSLIPR